IGPMGLAILLLGGWILTGVFINRNFIDTINGVGNNLVDKAGQVVERLRHHETQPDVEELTIDDEEEDIPAPVEPIEPQPQPIEPVEPEPQPAPVVEEEEDPFTVIDLPHHNDEEQITEPVEPEPVAPVEEQDPDDPFTVIDLKKDRPQPEPQPAPQPAPQPEPQPVPAPVEEEEGIVVIVEEGKEEEQIKKTTELYDPTKDLLTYKKPPFTLLEDYQSESEVSEDEIFENKSQIEETLKTFGIPIQRIKATVGPTVTLYEIVQAQGVKISKIQGLEQDIAQSLKASGIRIIAPIPGKGTIGIEVPNRHKRIVSMYSAIRSKRFHETKAELPVVIGRTIQNENYVFDLAKLPHLLVAGSTGTGKSVGLNAIITSLLYRKHPSELKLVMIDPKMVEFSLYGRLERHFLAKMESEDKVIITDPMKAVYTLQSLCVEMENRLELLSKADTRNIVQYNTKFTARRLNPEKGHRFLPYIVVVIDEFADLIMMAKEVERPVMRLAQKARAVGIHLIVATQRPDVKVITGGIKANFPARIAFRVIQMIDSRTILDRPGAEQLIGRGDMLFSLNGDVTRVQCALVDTDEVERIVDHISHQQGYTSAYLLPDYAPEGSESQMGSEEQDVAPKKYDSLFAEIARDAVESGSISTSMIQRNYEVGFNRAGRIMMQLERAGIVGRAQGAKPRDVLFHDLPSLEAKLQDLGLF
ncbi:MAG: DNA translocase FtsK, partial [Alistipes sp.]|nr:DNA translocase FtsK [Alistipes sp.]